ncbi:MAG: flavin-containing monooxygenase [Actinomycetota bacterium]
MTATPHHNYADASSPQHADTNHEYLDVLIVGAGLSGLSAAHHLQHDHPERTWAIVETRQNLGGTWDFFRYPGARSDSDMHTLGLRFHPWRAATAIVDQTTILSYLREASHSAGMTDRIRYNHRVIAAQWTSRNQRWTVEIVADAGKLIIECSFLVMCTGYYDYTKGHHPDLPGAHRFTGHIVHPQQWPPSLNWRNQNVVVIGSGASAVTLVPTLAQEACHVAMVQRSPSYIALAHRVDPVARVLGPLAKTTWGYRVLRWRRIMQQRMFFRMSRRWPTVMTWWLNRQVRRALPSEIAIHFAPSYKPWDQRITITADGDLFDVLRNGQASIHTDDVRSLTETGVQLASGKHLDADVIVTATGLNLLLFGGIELSVDGTAVDPAQRPSYRSVMIEGVPNFIFTLGYTNASWTLKADVVGAYLSRLMAYMDRRGYTSCLPRNPDPGMALQRFFHLQSGYITRSPHQQTRQGSKPPWQGGQDYLRDVIDLRLRRLNDGVLHFNRMM